jgi:hypothetical protein
MKLIRLALSAALFFTASSIAGSAWAGLIDFRDVAFTPDAGDSTFTTEVDGVTWTFDANPDGATLYWDDVDGYGVRLDYEMDEIEGIEELRISFSEALFVNEIHLTDLFNEHGYIETGWYVLNDVSPQVLFAAEPDQTPSPATNGVKVLDVHQMVTSISFGAPGLINGENHEFSVSGLDIAQPIPEPASAVLFLTGSGVVGLALWRKRERRSA